MAIAGARMTWQNLPGWSQDITDGPDAFYPWLAKQLPPNALHIEVGAFCFRSAGCLATLRPDVTVLCVDPWEADYKHLAGVDLVDLGGLPEDADILQRMPFYEAAMFLLKKHCGDLKNLRHVRNVLTGVMCFQPADAIFLDSDHTYDSGLSDMKRASEMLKPGGILSGHDYEYQLNGVKDPRFNPNPLFPGLVRAIDEYAATNRKRVVVGTGSKTEWSTCYRFEDL